jgi:mxaJ protein
MGRTAPLRQVDDLRGLQRVWPSESSPTPELIALANGFSARFAEADQAPLRVCADPNNLPYSDSAGDGFENKIVCLIADYLKRPSEFVWRAERRGFMREGLNAGECDLVAALPSGAPMALATRPYYRSTYVFVSKPDEAPVASFDDPSLRHRPGIIESVRR